MMAASEVPVRALKFIFVLGKGQFGQSGQNTLTVSGLRATVEMSAPGAGAKSTAHCTIYGMTPSQMNQMSTLGSVKTSQRFNTITIQVGNEGGSFSTVFTGTMWSAYGDYGQEPNSPFVVDATNALFESIKPAPVSSFVGTSDVATMLSGLATTMDFKFENSGVTAKLSNAYYYGSAWDQARKIVRDAGIEWNACHGNVLAIWNAGQSRSTPVPTPISVKTGMIGYPSFYELGIEVKTIFNPLIEFGAEIVVESSLLNAGGIRGATGGPLLSNIWQVNGLQHILESLTPGGLWESVVQATPPGYLAAPSIR